MQQIDSLLMNTKMDQLGRIDLQLVPDFQGEVDCEFPQCADICLRCWDDHFYLGVDVPQADIVLPWDLEQDLVLPAPFSHSLRPDKVRPFLPLNVSVQEISVRFRVGGERIKLMDESFHRSLKQCLQMWRIPPWYRHCVPLLYCRDELILVVGFSHRGIDNGESSKVA